MNRFLGIGLSLSIAAFAVPAGVFAQEATPAAPANVVDDVAAAKELNRKGLVFFDAGDYNRALPFFESSRALVPSHANTRNVALCLDGLGRSAEALRMYENLVRDYRDSLDARERTATEKRIAELQSITF
ncbi:MAG TPA: tetratricopeptide repeat protein, partial [Polyangium sp.]|nr:tetratricopeptide repeat protein [Polyangium sp.]